VLTVVLSVVATGVLLFPLLMGLNREVVRTSKAILAGNIELMEVLGSAIAKRDSDTNTHNYRVTLYAIELARTIKLPGESMRALIAGAFLHDVGKIGIPDAILLKPGKLDEQEFATMKTHVDQGDHILKKSTWLTDARDVVLNHHEKFNGGGYPRGIKGEDIPLSARIFAIVDVFDALTSERPYKAPMPLEQSLDILRRDAGSHFDPDLVAAFVNIAPALYRHLREMSDDEIEGLLRHKAAHYFGLD
jgi:HD-GYP domain-containing protein (c-di-GMP phosphodiesterase class II)